MRTTVALEAATRDRLVALKRAWGASSLDALLNRLLDGPALGARALYDARREDVDAVLARHRVKRVVAFGSRARGDARPDSDLDLAVSLPRGTDLLDLENVRRDLQEAFGVDVQVVPLDAVPPRLQARLDREGVSLVG